METSLFTKAINRKSLMKSACIIQRKQVTGRGIDGISCKEAVTYTQKHLKENLKALKNGTYNPLPAKRTEIPKPDGRIRIIGIPSVMDKVIQQSIKTVLEPLYEELFSDTSYGFRPNRNIHDAVAKAKEYLDNGYIHVIQIDISSFFDNINHDRMMSVLYKKIKDRDMLKLIRKYLQSGIIGKDGKYIKAVKGAVQGGNLSPLLANIYLDILDKELERQNIRFTRYADDVTLYCKSKEEVLNVLDMTERFIKVKLGMDINRNKTEIGMPEECVMLGFGFFKENGKYKSYIPEKTIRKLAKKICTNIDNSTEYGEAIRKTSNEIKGWYSNYRNADKFISVKSAKSLDRMILEKLYKKYGKGCNIKMFKEKLDKEAKVSMKKIVSIYNNRPIKD